MSPWKILAFTSLAKWDGVVVRLEGISAFITPLARVFSWMVRLEWSLRGRRAFRFKGGSFCVLALALLWGLKELAYGSP